MIYSNRVMVADETLLNEGFFEEIDRWKTHNQNHALTKFKSNTISDDDYEKIKSYILTMRQTEDYQEYKKAFDRFCTYCHILPRGVIIRTYDLTRGKEDRNSLYVEYTYNTKKITLPEGTVLYHMSKVGGITELIPAFKGKSARGFLYDKPRIYFTIRKNMPKFLADYKFNEKLHMYVCKEPIRQAYVDPLVWSNLQGAVYVESNKPIKVEEITKEKADKKAAELARKREAETLSNRGDKGAALKNESAFNEEDEFSFEHFYGFITESGLILDTSEE